MNAKEILTTYCQRTYIGSSALHGRGCFASRAYLEGELIDVWHTLRINSKAADIDPKYIFQTSMHGNRICLGSGSFLNNSKSPNAKVIYLPESRTLALYAVKTISHGNELTIDYDSSSE